MGGQRHSRHRWWFASLLFLVALPVRAEAHGAIAGADEFINGLLHPLFSPLHVLLLLALGLWLGQSPGSSLKLPLLAFAPISAAGLLITTKGEITAVYPPLLVVPALCAGLLVVIDLRLPKWGRVVLCAVAALALGLDSAAENVTSQGALAKTLIATWASLNVLLMDVAFYISRCPPRPWVRIGIRVVGSWVVAISLLILAFSFRK